MTRHELSKSFALVLTGLLVHSSPADEPAKRDRYFTPTAANSTSTMPRVIIRNIREDRAGNIWFATFGGPIRYDGKEFVNFGEEVGLAKTRIFSLLESRSGALWFGSITGGATRYNGKSFTRFTIKEGLGSNDVMWIFEDRDANIWLGTGNGVSRYDGKSMTNFTTKDGLVHNEVYAIAQDASGRIWFGTQGGIGAYDGKSFSNFADQVGRSFTNIRSIVVDRSGNIWFGGQGGAFRYDGKKLETFSTKEGLLSDFVGSMIVDRAGNVWLGHPGGFPDGSGGGASRYDGKYFQHFTQKDGLSSKTVYAMLEDKAGNIWFGSADAGACRYDGKTFTNFSEADPSAQQPANERQSTPAIGETVSEMPKDLWNVFQAKDGRHWFCSRTEGAFRYDGKTITRFTSKDGLSGVNIGGIQEDKLGNIYFSTDKGISKFDGNSFTTLEQPKAAGEWKNEPDDLWFAGGQDSGVVYRYDGKSLHRLAFPKTKAGDDATLPRDKFPNAKYSPYDVYTIFKDSKGHLWFGTAVLGACRYDGKSFTWIPEKELRNDNFGLRSIIEDKDGKFLFSNTFHRYAVDRGAAVGQGDASQWYRKEKGIGDLSGHKQDEYSHFMSSTRGDDGAIWMAILGGVVYRYDGTTMTRYPVTENGKHHRIFSIYKDRQGVMWLGTQAHGVYRFNGKAFTKFSATDTPPSQANPAKKPANDNNSAPARGETVSEMAKDLWHVFQGKNGHHWFGSHTQGAFRYDGKTITRFTKKDGLPGDEISGIQGDKSGNIYFTTDQGISKFDGRSFTTLIAVPAEEWKKEPDDVWFGGSGAVHRYDGKALHRLAFPKTKLGEDFMARYPRSKYPNIKSTPYDVYSILKDSKGDVWFGTQNLGVLRFDGKSHFWISEKEHTWLGEGPLFGLRSIIEDKDGKFWFTNTLHRYAIDRSGAVGPGDASQWYKKEKGIGDVSGHKQDDYSYFMSSTLGDDGAMWMAILGGVVYRYDGQNITRHDVTENGKHHWIFSIYKDNQGVLWLGTQEHGAYRFNGKAFEKFRP